MNSELKERFEDLIRNEHQRIKTKRDYACILKIMEQAYNLDRPIPSGETDNDDVAKHFKKLKVTDIPENHKPYYNGYNDGIEDCIIALSAHNQFAGGRLVKMQDVIKLLREYAKHHKQYGDYVEHRTVNEGISIIERYFALPSPPQNQKS
jgi:hypothetical protein